LAAESGAGVLRIPEIGEKTNKIMAIKTTLRTTGVSPWVKASQPKAGKRVLI